MASGAALGPGGSSEALSRARQRTIWIPDTSVDCEHCRRIRVRSKGHYHEWETRAPLGGEGGGLCGPAGRRRPGGIGGGADRAALAARKTVERYSNGETIEKVAKKNEDGLAIYSVILNSGGWRMEVQTTLAGDLNATEESVEPKDLPEQVAKTPRGLFPQGSSPPNVRWS
jgi:hypothetical protein